MLPSSWKDLLQKGQCFGIFARLIFVEQPRKGRRSCKELLGYGLSEGKLLECWAYTNHIALNTYINKRGLHQTVEV